MKIHSIETKFNYGLSKTSPVSIFVWFAYEDQYFEEFSISSLLEKLKETQDNTGCLDIIVGGNISEYIEDIYWVFSRMISSMRCTLVFFIDSLEQGNSVDIGELPSAMYIFCLDSSVPISAQHSHVKMWEKFKLSENDLIIVDTKKAKEIAGWSKWLKSHEIKVSVGFSSSRVEPNALIEYGCIDVIPIPMDKIWK